MDIKHLTDRFRETFGSQGKIRVFFSPGRINLIGEHTDYNGGHVFPIAINYGTYGIVRKRQDQRIRLFSLNFEDKGIIELELNEMKYDPKDSWANYPKGMIRYIQESLKKLPSGLDVLIYGNIPNGAGLSSSASIEILIGLIVNEIFNFDINRLDLVKVGKKVENEFIGVNSGIMDQFAVGMGKKNCGILLDCKTLNFKYAPLDLEGYKIIIMNTNKRRELLDSKYNERIKECEDALKYIQQERAIYSLGELTEEEFESLKYLIEDDVLIKRAKHIVYENHRTLKSLEALKNSDLIQFGKLMNQSHISLRDDYEVTGLELDLLVESAWKHENVIGARMTGAGFGGCAIAIVKDEEIEQFISRVSKKYEEEIGYSASFYVASIGDGAKEISLNTELFK